MLNVIDEFTRIETGPPNGSSSGSRPVGMIAITALGAALGNGTVMMRAELVHGLV